MRNKRKQFFIYGEGEKNKNLSEDK